VPHPTNVADGALARLRVIDLSGPAGYYCTKLLADLGADVVRVEATGGEWPDPGPFFGDVPQPDRSLYRYHFHTNKRSVAADVSTPNGRRLLQRLLATADILVETFPRAQAAALGLDPKSVRGAHAALIHVSITGFGAGDYEDFRTTDLIAQAMGGLMSITGFPDDPPNQVGAEQAYHCASLHAAVGALLALAQRDADGVGRHVEVSLQDAISLAILQTANFNFYTMEGLVPSRSGNQPRVGGAAAARLARNPAIFACSDGWITYTTPPNPPRQWSEFVSWLEEYDAAGELADPRFADPEVRVAEAKRILDTQFAFFAAHTRQELYHGAQRHGLLCMPVQTVEDLLDDEQLRARDFVVEVDHPELGRSFRYPGAPYRLSETPFAIRRRAPQVGEDNAEVLREWLGLSADETARLIREASGG
jgi:benzylsuccinate CoA-transferase BbsE subunit